MKTPFRGKKGECGKAVTPLSESPRGRRFLLLCLLLRRQVEEGVMVLSCALLTAGLSLSCGGARGMRMTLCRIKLPRLPPHHDDALHGGVEKPMVLSSQRTVRAVRLGLFFLFGDGCFLQWCWRLGRDGFSKLGLMVRRQGIWHSSPTTSTGYAGFVSRLAQGTSGQHATMTCIMLLEGGMYIESNAFKAMVIPWTRRWRSVLIL
jgi:hypothetical protein